MYTFPWYWAATRWTVRSCGAQMYNALRDHGQKGATVEAISAVDIALWDIAGKALGLPVYQLMGGAGRTHVRPYATGFYRTPDTTDANLIDEALLYAEQGFTGMKVKVGFGVEHDARLIRDIRRAVGDRVVLMIDANHAYNATDALALARRVEDLEIGWFEEPVPPEDLRGYCEVRNGTTIPISGGEAEFTRYGFARLLDARAVDIVQPDCCVTGGLSEFANVAMLATIHDIRCCPHIWGQCRGPASRPARCLQSARLPRKPHPRARVAGIRPQHQRAARGTEPEPYSHGRWLDRSAREAGTWV